MGGRERANCPEVEMRHGQVYQLALTNHGTRRCDATVQIDGKAVGNWRVPAGQLIVLERPPDQPGKFTFFILGTTEAQTTGIRDNAMLGVIEVTFTPEAQAPLFSQRAVPKGGGANFLPAPPRALPKVGGTGLSGKSEQQYGTAENIEYDRGAQVAIRLRLVRFVAMQEEFERTQYSPLGSPSHEQPVTISSDDIASQKTNVRHSGHQPSGCLNIARKVGVGIAIVVALAIIGIFATYQHIKSEEETSKHRILPSEVELVGLTLGSASSDPFRSLKGRIRNHSTNYTLDSVQLKIILIEVPQNEMVGEAHIALPIDVPRNQTRSVDTTVYFTNLPAPNGHFEWSYAIEEVRGH